jgi:hypothetical protein
MAEKAYLIAFPIPVEIMDFPRNISFFIDLKEAERLT